VVRPLADLFPAEDYPQLLVGLAMPDDAAVYRLADDLAIVSTVDFFPPVVDDAYTFGAIAAANALSDIYAMGGEPLFALNLAAFPDDQPPEVLTEIFRGGAEKVREAGAVIAGGHTVTDKEPKYGLAVTGKIDPRRILAKQGVQAGDRLVLTKPLGTGVLATALKQQRLDPPQVRRLTRTMTALNRGAAEAAVEFGAHAATDVTGFGLVGHAVQLAEASGVTLRLRPSRRWFLPRVLELAAQGAVAGGLKRNREFYAAAVGGDALPEPMVLALHDPQTSGGLLVACAPRRLAGLLAALRRRRVWAVEVGEALPRGARALELVAP
jgi:selenide,water dikinase